MSPVTLQLMDDMRMQFLDLLSDIGFVDKSRGANVRFYDFQFLLFKVKHSSPLTTFFLLFISQYLTFQPKNSSSTDFVADELCHSISFSYNHMKIVVICLCRLTTNTAMIWR